MGIKVKALGWWMIPLLSVASLAATSSDLRLVEAVAKRDKEAVRHLLQEHADVNAAQADGATALAWAAHWDDLETAELLIRGGANVNAANELGVTPLSLACTNGSAAMVDKLLKAGANPNAALQSSGETALMTCAHTGNVDAVRTLVAHGADVNAKETEKGQTVLMWAVAQKHPKVAVALIEHKADIHARSKGGFTPLLFAAQQGDLESARVLLAMGANVNEATPQDGSALVVASASGQEALALFLLDKGADPNAADGDGITALHYALQKGISILDGVVAQSVLSYLFRPNMQQLVKALLAHGANPNARIVKIPRLPNSRRLVITPAGATPFLLAAATYDVPLMHVLLAAGADPRLTTKENTTPLMMAAGMGEGIGRLADLKEGSGTWSKGSAMEAVKLTVELGNDVNAANETGLTALHGAAYTGSNAIIQFLVERGAKVNVKDKFGQTPLSISERFYPVGLAEFLRPLFIHESTANLLLKLGATPTDRSAAATLGGGARKLQSVTGPGTE